MKEIEPTVEVFEKEKDIDKKLTEAGFELVEEYSVDDIYMSNQHESIKELSSFEILKNSFLIRNINDEIIQLVYKNKEFDEKGQIISEEKYRIPIEDIENAKKFFENLGFKEIFQMYDEIKVYKKGEVELQVEKVKNLGIFIELEMFAEEEDVDSKREEIHRILKGLPIKIGEDFDIKKAHLMLNRIREK
jgi:predicted adenylyl cyclase CyaB